MAATEHNVSLDPEKGMYQQVELFVDCSISSALFSEVFVHIVEISPYFEMMLYVIAYWIFFSAEKISEQPNSTVPVNNHFWQNTVCFRSGPSAQENNQLAPVPQKMKTRDLPLKGRIHIT